ncbi:polyprenyl synthetase family protein [Streptococcus didelphis]|uniref:Polyprenyl synthetase family protein n=1 Tax=Streptococcus didelphis TaxID=102886 RepID=A0ABY9LGQ1_9STRE|nr:farnesyl diphosphate synthase [Streptococcus didelphis]WMB28067.1 polyprenyl synthetase family protein [Streptococcus didelphis]WMB29978.1 polyprenyl synthetase family protein [Streptococcus didelphis]
MTKEENINQAIRRFYQDQLAVSDELIEAILYSVNAGGKRIRPLILLEILEALDISLTQSHFDIAAALEMIHTGSLIHDDLPAMDNDDYRRGHLTNHKKFDEATAILAGDSLFLDPFALIARSHLAAEIKLELIEFLSSSSGSFGMVAGQMLDMKAEGKELDLTSLQNIHINKTGRLLAFPFWAAAKIAQLSKEDLYSFHQMGQLIGHAFQVRDDILDLTADFEKLGKTPQKDIAAHKMTYPHLLGLEESYQVLNRDLDQTIYIMRELEGRIQFKAANLISIVERLRLND